MRAVGRHAVTSISGRYDEATATVQDDLVRGRAGAEQVILKNSRPNYPPVRPKRPPHRWGGRADPAGEPTEGDPPATVRRQAQPCDATYRAGLAVSWRHGSGPGWRRAAMSRVHQGPTGSPVPCRPAGRAGP